MYGLIYNGYWKLYTVEGEIFTALIFVNRSKM